jgi:hypothetical protein
VHYSKIGRDVEEIASGPDAITLDRPADGKGP